MDQIRLIFSQGDCWAVDGIAPGPPDLVITEPEITACQTICLAFQPS